MKLLIAAGGTGGHINPGISIAEAVRVRWPQSDILFVCSQREIEERIYTRKGLSFIKTGARGMRPGIAGKIVFLWAFAVSIFESVAIIRRFRPDIVLGMGGYVSTPPVIAARLCGVPALLHEQNSIPGKANRLAARYATAVMTGFPAAAAWFGGKKVVFTGNPIRTGLCDARAADGYERFSFTPGVFTVLVVGGSQGAVALNERAVGAFGILQERGCRFQVVHMAGKARDQVSAAYAAKGIVAHCETYFEDIGLAYRTADLVISRAGAIALAEIAAFAKPSILVPYPHSADGHQLANARYLADGAAAVVMEESALTDETLAERIYAFYSDGGMRERYGANSGRLAVRDAQARVIEVVNEVMNKAVHTHVGRD
ncbi:MAG TPA: undecaprenyldiphospho-muramoylpentapeptide beta-N-acetylglucosaminyltransferase [bacterium]|nr:undecaprenyldiphospho-muramoylpentapeptide beta-N-acetylglucosaminyltransferase [bacterium]